MSKGRRHENGSGLIVVILIVAFLAGIGLSLLTLTSMSPKVSGSLRYHEEAFNAAEAGFDAARLLIQDRMSSGQWTSFDGHYLTQPTGIDLPLVLDSPNSSYFRRKTDQELLQAFDPNGDGTPDVANLLFFNQTLATSADFQHTYTVFLINDEAGGGTADARDALLVTIGVVRAGNRILDTARLEILLGY